MSKITVPESSGIAGIVSAICASFTLAEIGAMVGIVTAILSFMLNAIYMRRKDAREQRQADLAARESEARLAALDLHAPATGKGERVKRWLKGR